MRIPSYDDLEPSIPDISMRDTFAQVNRLVSSPPLPASHVPRSDDAVDATAPSALFACLRSPRTPEVIAGVAREFSPRIERHGTTAVVLDVSGLGRLLGDAQAIGAELNRIASLRAAGVRVAVAPTQTAARLLAIAMAGLTIRTGDAGGFLADLPVTALRQLVDERAVPRAGSREGLRDARTAIETFQRWGLKTLGEIAALPPADLSQRMGQEGLALQRLARGLDPAPLVPDPGVPRYIASLELEWPIDALEPLSFILPRLLDPLSAALERADRGAAAIRLDLRLTDRTTHARVLQLPAALRDARVLRTLLLLDLESHPPAAAIDIVSIEIDPAPGRIVQYSLLARATPSPETMATLMARLGALVGDSRCGTPVLLDTHRPDGFEMRAPNSRGFRLQAEGQAGRIFGLKAEATGVMGGLKAEATDGTAQLRRFRPPVAVRVTCERNRPVQIAIDRRGMPGGRIEQSAGPWRSSGDWWDAAATAWNRDEWDVVFADGTMCRIFQDRSTGTWFVEGILD